jgi:hypothetical protein
MPAIQLKPEQIAALTALANGIIPASKTDAGARAVNAGSRLAAMIEAGTNAALYLSGLETAFLISGEMHRRPVSELQSAEIHQLLGAIRERLPGFFKQLRMDVSALYLSDPAVWQRIGFPGPSTASGGYTDFDQPQTEKIISLKEPTI